MVYRHKRAEAVFGLVPCDYYHIFIDNAVVWQSKQVRAEDTDCQRTVNMLINNIGNIPIQVSLGVWYIYVLCVL